MCGGWNGRMYLNSIEILDIANNRWDIYYCTDGSLVPCSNNAMGAFLDTDSGGKDEKFVVFGGQSYESHFDNKKTQDVIEDNEECDLESERENMYTLEMKEEYDPDHLSIADKSQLGFYRDKYEPKLFAEDPIDNLYINEPPPKFRTMFIECKHEKLFKNLLICYEQKLGTLEYKFTFGVK